MSDQKVYRERLFVPHGVPEEARLTLKFFADFYNREIERYDTDKEQVAQLSINNIDVLEDDAEIEKREAVAGRVGQLAGRKELLGALRTGIELTAHDLGGGFIPPGDTEVKPLAPDLLPIEWMEG